MLLTTHLCSQIAAHIPSHRHTDLHALLYTNKTFHDAVLPRVYSKLIFPDIARTSKFTYTINHVGPHLAGYVRTFGIALGSRSDKSAEDADFWEGVTSAMKRMSALESLIFVRLPGPSFTFFLADTEWPFKLRQVELQLVVDDHIMKFVNTQAHAGRLHVVQFYPSGTPALSDKDKDKGIVLPTVDLLDTSLSLIPYIQAPSLIHLQFIFDYSTAVTDSADITHIFPTFPGPPLLRSLSIVDLPAHLSTRTLAHLVSSSPPSFTHNLLHLSHFHLPEPYPARSAERSSFLASLSAFRRLRSLEVSLDAWDVDLLPLITRISSGAPLISSPLFSAKEVKTYIPIPAVDDNGFNTQLHSSQGPQRALIAEMATFCSTLRTIVFWYRQTRFRWVFVEDEEGSAVRAGRGYDLHERNMEDAPIAAASRGIIRSANGVEPVSPRIKNSAIPGNWHFRVEVAEWPGYSNLWCAC